MEMFQIQQLKLNGNEWQRKVKNMSKKVFIVVQKSEHEGFTGIEGVYASRALAEAAVAEAEALLVEDEMEDSYSYDIETSFLIEE